jgi:hopanoid-associated phosphorylase
MLLGVLTGLACEVECLPSQTPEMLIACAAAMPERAESISHQFIDQDCRALLSFGIAGSLCPDIQVGDIVVSTGVKNAQDDVIVADDVWLLRVFELLGQEISSVHKGLIYGSDIAITSAQLKSDIYAKSKALCVDMETHRMALVAQQAAIPFLAIRVISDDATRAIPSAALGVIGENGKPQIGRVLKGLLRHPNQIPALMALSKDMKLALATLRRVPGILGPLFGAA